MGNKLLACRSLEGDFMPLQAFQNAQSNHFFAEENNPTACYVTPYFMVTDGRDVLTWEREDNLMEIGWKFAIEKESQWWNPFKKNPGFDDIVESAVEAGFLSMWKAIKTYDSVPEQIEYAKNCIIKVGVSYKDLHADSINVHSTNRGTYNIMKKFFLPIYFLVMPNTKTVNLIPVGDEKPCIPVDFKWLAAMSDKLPLTFEAKKIMEMIRSGDIVLPIISQSKTWPNEE